MLTDQPTQLSFFQLFDALPDGVLYFRPVFDEVDQQLVDFVVDYANPAVRESILNGYQATVGASVRHDNWQNNDTSERVFTWLKSVVETGQSGELEYYNQTLNEWLSITQAKSGDGVLVITRIITASKEVALANERQQILLNSILDTTLNTTFVYEAIRDEAGHIQDFKVLLVNEQGRRDAMVRLGVDPIGKTLLTINPNSRQGGQFNVFCRVIESGEPVQVEQFYPDAQRAWYNTAITKLNDGVVVTGIDITRQKQSALETEHQAEINKRQANFLNNVLDASSNGIVAERAVRDAEGTIVDFRIISANQQAALIVHSTVEQLIGRSDLELHPELRSSGLFDAYVKTVETGEPQTFETHYNDGRLDHWVEVRTRKLADEELVITFANVSDVKRTQHALEQQITENERQTVLMKNMLDGAINGVLLLEPVYNNQQEISDFQILAANRAVERLTGARPAEAVGRTMLEVYPAYKKGGFFVLYCEVLLSGQPQLREYYYEDDTLKGWFNVSVAKQGDGVVLTFANTTEIRQARQAIEQTRADLQAVIDNSQTGIFVFSPVFDDMGDLIDFRFKTINRMVAALVGQTPDAIAGALASEWFISYRETDTFERYKRTLSTGEEQRFDTNYNVDGFDVWFDVKSVKLGDDVLVTFTNYTDLKRTQQAVERQASLLTSVLDSSNSGIIAFESIRNEQGTIVDFYFATINEACERILGVPVETMRGNTLLTLFPGNVDAGTFGLYVNTTETGEPGRTETYYNYDGLDFWLDISAQQLGDGFVVTFTDISVMKRAAQLVERSAAELQTVIDTSQTGIFLFSPVRNETGEVVDFRFRLANRMLANYVGQEPEAVIGALGSHWFPDYKTNGLFDAYRKTYLTGEAQRFDIHYDGSGIDVWLDIMVTKTGDEILVTFGDYTPLKKLQQQLEASVVDLQRSNANLEQFAYVASHDLQEPLRKIQAFGDIIETQYGPIIGEQGADMIRRMQSAAARMQVLIKDVLAYSRVTTKRDAIVPVDLDQLVGNVVEDLETAIAHQEATLTIDPLPTVAGDAGQLRQLFQNLLSNALKFVKPRPPGESGTPAQRSAFIAVTTRLIPGRDAGISIPPGDADRLFHLIEISDNGIGFEPYQAERIFHVFQRLHSRSDYQGTGIGLAIVKKVVENHNGHIQAVGRPGEGATFRILLPA
ncbi:hypothetical protein GCM10027423_48680 [Spirosoma arcticum]